jgi:hypothetical protein
MNRRVRLTPRLGRTWPADITDTSFGTYPSGARGIPGKEANLPQIHTADVTEDVRRVGRDGDDASTRVRRRHGVAQGALTLTIKADDDFFHLMHVCRNLGTWFQDVFVSRAVFGAEFLVRQVVPDAIGVRRNLPEEAVVYRHGQCLLTVV